MLCPHIQNSDSLGSTGEGIHALTMCCLEIGDAKSLQIFEAGFYYNANGT
jgi:hypothetical protein